MSKKDFYEQIGVAMTCRSFEEYEMMFRLSEKELSLGPILDVAAGGSSFAAGAAAAGYDAQAIDPRYDGEAADWVKQAAAEIETSTAKLGELADRFDWSFYGSLEQHKAGRVRSLELFRKDLESSAALGLKRYQAGRLPQLQLDNDHYGLVLCSHFLFLYAEQFGFEFHVQAVRELVRVCRPGGQVRIYPLLSLKWEPYPRLDELVAAIEADGMAKADVRVSGLPFIPGSEHFLLIEKSGRSI